MLMRIFSSEPTGEALVRGMRSELCFGRRRNEIVQMRAMYEQGTV
jgi:hypothetical protein